MMALLSSAMTGMRPTEVSDTLESTRVWNFSECVEYDMVSMSYIQQAHYFFTTSPMFSVKRKRSLQDMDGKEQRERRKQNNNHQCEEDVCTGKMEARRMRIPETFFYDLSSATFKYLMALL